MNLIRTFVFNPIQTNTYVVQQAETDPKGVIIDPACATEAEFAQLSHYIEERGITIERVVLTHPHFDHLMGAAAVCRHYGLPLCLHEKAQPLLAACTNPAFTYGMPVPALPEKLEILKTGARVPFGDTALEVRYTPGHCEGSVVYVWDEQQTVFTGDVLFRDSIGRTDLPTGDWDVLRKSILEQVFTLDDAYTVRPGHGGRTSVGYERTHNPFLGLEAGL